MDSDQADDAVALTEASTDDLRQLAAAVASGELRLPLKLESLGYKGFGHLGPSMAPFLGLDAPAFLGVIRAVLAERRRAAGHTLELVWSGSDAGPSYARRTDIVIPELISKARRQITIAGYSFDRGTSTFDDLHRAMLAQEVAVRLFLDIEQLSARLEQQLKKDRSRRSRLGPLRAATEQGGAVFAREVLGLFRELFWPHTDRALDLFYDPRTADHRAFASLHAKCVIVDHEHVLITSANFTGRAQERNIEVGVLLHDKAYAVALERQWNNLVDAGEVVRG